MDQQKIGNFLKTLRKEKGITQEQFAETLNVARRTVSRWETGSNMPDLAVLTEIADYYDVELRELLDGERRSELMNQETKETVMKVADLNNEQNERFNRYMHGVFLFGCAAAAVLLTVIFLEPENPSCLRISGGHIPRHLRRYAVYRAARDKPSRTEAPRCQAQTVRA